MPIDDRTELVLLAVTAALVTVLGAMTGVNGRLADAAMEMSVTPTFGALPSDAGRLLLFACLVVGSVLLLRGVLRP